MRNVLISGGSRGIGAACVRKYAACGDKVVFLYEKSDDAAHALAGGTGAECVSCDVSDSSEVRQAVSRSLSLFGEHARSADVLICNAGISVEGLIQDLTDSEWSRLSGVNLTGAVNMVREVVPGMISKKSGSIVLMSSMWGRSGASYEAAYSATKAALIGLGEGLARELGPSGIRVNMVAPGVIDTDMNRGRSPEDWKEIYADTPLGRAGKPWEVAELVYFLTSDKAGFITGQTIGIDGGFII